MGRPRSRSASGTFSCKFRWTLSLGLDAERCETSNFQSNFQPTDLVHEKILFRPLDADGAGPAGLAPPGAVPSRADGKHSTKASHRCSISTKVLQRAIGPQTTLGISTRSQIANRKS